jgi:hypothetical protein
VRRPLGLNHISQLLFFLEPQLGIHVLRILADYFRDIASPGLIVYAEYLAANLPVERATTEALRRETEMAATHRRPDSPFA